MFMPIARKARTAARMPLFVQAWLLPTWLLLGLSRTLIMLVPFARLAPWLGHSLGAQAWVPLPTSAHEHRARLVGLTVRTAARYAPWMANCFPQAVTARWLLALYRVPCALCLGVRPDKQGSLEAHAWVCTGRIRVTGGEGFTSYHVIGCFVDAASLST